MENVSAATTTPPGWHPDPLVPGHVRWWSGAQWTEHVKPIVAQAAAPFPVAAQAPVTQRATVAVPYQPSDPRDRHPIPSEPESFQNTAHSSSIFQENPASFLAVAVSVMYLVIAYYTGYVLLGIVPACLGFNAFSEREKLWPLALLAAGVAISFSLTTLGIL